MHVVGQVSQLSNVLGADTLGLVVGSALREPQRNKNEDNDLGDVGLGRGDRKLTTTVEEHSAVVLTSQRRVDLVDHIDTLKAGFFGQSERNQEVHGFTGLTDTQDGSLVGSLESIKILARDLGRNLALDVREAAQLPQDLLSIPSGVVGSTTGCQEEGVDLHQVVLVVGKTSKSHEGLVSHQSSSIVERFLDALGLVHHLHDIVVINARRLLNAHLLLSDLLDLLLADLVVERKFDDLTILDIVVVLRVVLEDCRVTRNNLELVGARQTVVKLYLTHSATSLLSW